MTDLSQLIDAAVPTSPLLARPESADRRKRRLPRCEKCQHDHDSRRENDHFPGDGAPDLQSFGMQYAEERHRLAHS